MDFVHVLSVFTGKSYMGLCVALEAIRLSAQRTAHCFLAIRITDEIAVSCRTVIEGFICLNKGVHETAVKSIEFLLTDACFDVRLTHIKFACDFRTLNLELISFDL